MNRSVVALFATLASLAVILEVAVAGAMGGGRALASHVGCGAVITTDTTLDSDLTDCPNNGIIIGADDITLDLNGHRIDGDGTEFADCPKKEICDVGVVNDGHDDVTVRDGSAREFGVGAFVGKARHNRVLGISSSRNTFFGFVVALSPRTLIRDSSGNASTVHRDGTGLGLFDSHRVRIVRNTFRDNAGDHAIVMVDSNYSLIKGNRLSRNDGEGLLMEGGEHNQINHNRVVDNRGGITLGPGSENVIAHNHVSGGRDGIRIEKGHGNLVADNVVVDTSQAGIRLGIPNPLLGGENNVVRENLVRGSRKDGFVVGKKDHHSLLKRNLAKESGDDGFNVQSRTTKLTKNRARNNGDLGIEAVDGTKNGGGNRASGNGDQRQCVNVKCH
jgi:parallel beta-helix repeat protein